MLEMTTSEPPAPRSANREAIDAALELLRTLDDTAPTEMTALFYEHGFWELDIALRGVLRAIGEDVPD